METSQKFTKEQVNGFLSFLVTVSTRQALMSVSLCQSLGQVLGMQRSKSGSPHTERGKGTEPSTRDLAPLLRGHGIQNHVGGANTTGDTSHCSSVAWK